MVGKANTMFHSPASSSLQHLGYLQCKQGDQGLCGAFMFLSKRVLGPIGLGWPILLSNILNQTIWTWHCFKHLPGQWTQDLFLHRLVACFLSFWWHQPRILPSDSPGTFQLFSSSCRQIQLLQSLVTCWQTLLKNSQHTALREIYLPDCRFSLISWQQHRVVFSYFLSSKSKVKRETTRIQENMDEAEEHQDSLWFPNK